MTPKEKAKELVKRFPNNGFAKTCALIAVDEILEEISNWSGGESQEWEKERWKYLLEVKQEIKKLW